uniref:Uncharacterized protein n=1 Tax=Romanomermis culicivorax TaxID=13658 RepID=A0A915HWL6_ROMCU
MSAFAATYFVLVLLLNVDRPVISKSLSRPPFIENDYDHLPFLDYQNIERLSPPAEHAYTFHGGSVYQLESPNVVVKDHVGRQVGSEWAPSPKFKRLASVPLKTGDYLHRQMRYCDGCDEGGAVYIRP